LRCPDRSEAANVETATCALTPGMILSEAISSRFNPVDALFFCHQIFFTLGKDPQVRIVFLLSYAGFSDILCYFLIELFPSVSARPVSASSESQPQYKLSITMRSGPCIYIDMMK